LDTKRFFFFSFPLFGFFFLCWWISRLEFHVYYFDSFVETKSKKSSGSGGDPVCRHCLVFLMPTTKKRQNKKI
jgi:hypothetical protein